MEFFVDLSQKTTPFPHFWERCVGSCHAATALRADWRKQLSQCHKELGFQYVRFHGLLDDDMSVYIQTQQGPLYSFYNIDLIFDFLLEIGMKPFIELGYMPEDLASGDGTVFHYKGNVTLPRDYAAWGQLIEELTRHLVERYGIEETSKWFFEVWNEPNLQYFWRGTQEEYFRLYQYTVLAIKKVDPRLVVGGPATAVNAWIPEMIAFCQQNDLPLDFISTHHYPTDAAIAMGENMEEMMANAGRGILKQMAVKARREAGSRQLFYSEWNSSPDSRDSYHDQPYAAAFAVKTIADMDGIVDLYSWWTFSDIFEESGFPSQPFHGGFGLLNLHGISKPNYHIFRFLHRLGTRRVNFTAEPHPTVEALAVRKGRGLEVLVYNHNVPLRPIQEEPVVLRLHGLAGKGWSARIERVDDSHANPRRAWLEMGAPEYLNPAQVEALKTASAVCSEPAACLQDGDDLLIRLVIPPHGVAAVTIVQQQ
jgi:xylan 1,4-beta-xylosidase